MKQTTADRQRNYRRRHIGPGGSKSRLQVIVPTTTWLGLRLLAHHAGVSVADYLTEIAGAEICKLTATMTPNELHEFSNRLP
jgi:hypothetical protein